MSSGLGARRSANKKIDVVVRLLRGEPIEDVSRQVGVEVHRLAAWRDDFLESGKQGLKAKRPRGEEDRRLAEAERKIGELTMENEILRRAEAKRGLKIPASEAAETALEGSFPLVRVCEVLGASRSMIYHRRRRGDALGCRLGPATDVSDDELVTKIRLVLTDSPFAGEGYRKVRARLRREHDIRAGGKRVLRLMRREGLLAPQRVRGRRRPRPHDGTIIPDGPNLRWGTDATMAWTRLDGWVWVFACVDHWSAGAWTHVAKTGDRIAALQPIQDAGVGHFGGLAPDVARGVKLRHDWGPQYRSHHFLGTIAWLGLDNDAAFIGEPETNGCAERFIRTLKEQCLWADLHDTVDHLRQAVRTWTQVYNTEWLIQRHGHMTPREAFASATSEVAA